jgi:hypothetical protein
LPFPALTNFLIVFEGLFADLLMRCANEHFLCTRSRRDQARTSWRARDHQGYLERKGVIRTGGTNGRAAPCDGNAGISASFRRAEVVQVGSGSASIFNGEPLFLQEPA